MPIMSASNITWSPPPRCPACGDGILPSGRSMPFAVDAEGRVYCRRHGSHIDPTYPTKLEEYETWRRLRSEAIKACEYIVERIKHEVPVWGKEILEDGSGSWKVNTV